MRVFFAGDHAGFEMKGKLIEFVRSLGHTVEDLGPLEPKAGDDYPDFVIPLAKKVAGNQSTEVRGVVVAGSGQGEIIAMNRIKGARAALFCPCNLELIKASRDHNDSNIFAIGARFCTLDEAKKGITVWLETPFSNEERHIRRLKKIDSTY
jgi:ribose 5-phosphate isomerase B